jgi:hypothetical protein
MIQSNGGDAQLYGHNGFAERVRKRTGREPSRGLIREMEAAGAIHPAKSDSV